MDDENEPVDLEGRQRGDSCGFIIERKKILEELRKSEERFENMRRFETLGILAEGFVHKFNNVLTGAIGNISLSKNLCGPGDRIKERLEKSELVCREAENPVRKLLPFSKGGTPVRGRESSRYLIEGSVISRAGDFAGRIQWEVPDGLWDADVDRDQISIALQNVTRKAVNAMEGQGLLRIEVRNRRLFGENPFNLPPGFYVVTTDGGPGMLPDVKAVASSGYSDDPVLSRFRDYGFVAAIPKPYSMEQMKSVLVSVLGKDHPLERAVISWVFSPDPILPRPGWLAQITPAYYMRVIFQKKRSFRQGGAIKPGEKENGRCDWRSVQIWKKDSRR